MTCGGAGDDTLDGGADGAGMRGGLGDDLYIVTAAGGAAVESAGEGRDTVRSSIDYILRVDVEDLQLVGAATKGNGNPQANRITGNGLNNVLLGLAGDDTIEGGAGIDLITGGAGKDFLRGGTGRDTFLFNTGEFGGATTATADRIVDFSQAEDDRIYFSRMDADTTAAGDQAFSFIGSAAFSAAGQLRAEVIGGVNYVFGNTDANLAADFAIRVDGAGLTLVQADFAL